MVLQASARSVVRFRVARFLLLALGGLLIGHQAVYLTEYGDGAAFSAAMTAGGHDGYWAILTTVALSGVLLLLARSAYRLAQLRGATGADLAAATDAAAAAAPPAPATVRPYRRELLALWPPLFGTVAVAYLIQENIEHFVAQGHFPGFAPLVGAAAPLALPVLAAVTLAFALVGALVRWRTALLEAQVAARRAGRARWRRLAARPRSRWPLVAAICATFWSLARQAPVRAPPDALA